MEYYSDVCLFDLDCIELVKVVQVMIGLVLSSVIEVIWLVDGVVIYVVLLEVVVQVYDYIYLEYYIFNLDYVGIVLCDVLVECVCVGVQVCLLLDVVGLFVLFCCFLQFLFEVGGEVIWFYSWQLLKLFKCLWLNLCMYCKLVIVDGCLVFIGGINIIDEEDESCRFDVYCDLYMCIRGYVVCSLQLVFVEDWFYVSGQEFLWMDIVCLWLVDMLLCGDGVINVQVLVFGLDLGWEMIYWLYVVVIQEVYEWVWLVMFYFVLGEVVWMVLILVVLGGLDVCLLVLKMSDFWFVIQVVCLYFDELLYVGVKIYEYGLCMLYIKVFIVDDDVCIVGSVNFDYCSFCLNFELLMMISD